jgi:hypothetical protein
MFVDFVESVVELLPDIGTFSEMLREASFTVVDLFGSFDGAQFDPHSSEECTFVLRREPFV